MLRSRTERLLAWRRAWQAVRRGLSSWKVVIGLAGLTAMVLIAILGPYIAPYNPDNGVGAVWQSPSAAHLLGTTESGQDVLSQLLVGAGPSLLIGFVAAVFATLLSVIFGMLSAYLRGFVGESMTFVSNVFLVIPTLPLLIVIGAYLPNTNYTVLALVIGITSWAWGARVIRAQVLSLKARDYILAARASGERLWRILIYELLPGLIPVIAASFLFMVAYAILTEAGLAFLGLADVTRWTWGTMLYWAQNDDAFLSGAWWWYVPPGLAIALVGVFLGLINYGIDEFSNSRLREVAGPSTSRRKLRALRHKVEATPPRPSSNSREPSDDIVLRIDELSVEFDPRSPLRAVDEVSLEIGRREIFGIAGESGCGKTTLLHSIARILPTGARIAGGSIVYLQGGQEPVDILTLRGETLRKLRWAKIAIVTQAAMNALNPVMRIERQLTDVLAAHDVGGSRRERSARASELLSLVGIPTDRLSAYPHELSGGMRQRVMIAMALALGPEVLLLDEPTTALDVVTQRQIVDEVIQLRDRLGISIVFVTHDLALLLETSDRIAVMYAGKVVEVASSAEMRSSPSHPYTRALLDALPKLHGRSEGVEQLPGAPPDMRHVPPGCRFHPRCRFAFDRCSLEEPPLISLAGEGGTRRQVACHLVVDPTAVQFEMTQVSGSLGRVSRLES